MSELDEQVTCNRHGSSRATYVCGHAARGEIRGFHFDATADDPWPDAWCDRCDEIVVRDGGWNDENEKLADLSLLCGACWDDRYEKANPREMPQAELRRRVSAAIADVDARQRAIVAKTGMGRFPRYHYDQESATFELRDASEVPAWRARFLIAGTWAAASQSWLWGWANNSLEVRCTGDVVKVKREGERLGIKRLWRSYQQIQQADAEELWILAAEMLAAEAVYACRSPKTTMYLLLFDLVAVH